MLTRFIVLLGILMSALFHDSKATAQPWTLQLQYQEETAEGTGRFHRLSRDEKWAPEQTAIIVCDVWDLHHCLNAVQRLNQFAPRLNRVLAEARGQGATIIHSPSDCMPAYEGHAARIRAATTPIAKNLPTESPYWCSSIPGEEKGLYPIDQSDGGEDDDPLVHAQWATKLTAMGRNAGTPWKTQSSHIEIDAEKDYISDRGDEVWNVLEAKGIKNVILTGVHVNMCVLGRPFGLRQMARNGKNVVLMRDMTDSMYSPRQWPFVSHFTGNDLIIGHIERFVSPTITSDQLIGGEPFEFHDDPRKHLVIVCAEDEYLTEQTLPRFALRYLGHDFRVSYVWGSARERNLLPGIDVLDDADLMLVSVRRRVLPKTAMETVKRFVALGKPVVGIRTASHAFSLRNAEVPEGFDDWPQFDAHVFGGSYTNHHGNKLVATALPSGKAPDHPILAGLSGTKFRTGGSLYMTAPLADGALPLLLGSVEGKPQEPVAWTFLRDEGGKSFYTSLGHIDDFENPEFLQLLVRGIYWASDLPVTERVFQTPKGHWQVTQVPHTKQEGAVWYRCVIRLGKSNAGLNIETSGEAWFNGSPINADGDVPEASIYPNDANLLVVRVNGGLVEAPKLHLGAATKTLAGNWQFRIDDKQDWSNMPLPAKFGAGSDVVFPE